MTVVDTLTPEYYYVRRMTIEIRPDVTLTTDSLSFFTDIEILNADGRRLGDDSPTPQITPAQRTAFLNWVNTNLAAYEAAIGLARYTQ